MRKLTVGPGLALPPDTVTATLVVYGGKGMGKTNFGSVLVEEMSKAGLRWSVLDPLGVWWGLRHSADGKGPGIECLIIGGTHGDLPLEPTAGVVIADLVAEEDGTNVVIDFSRKPNGEMWSVGERIRFVTDYALRLFQRQGELIRGERRAPLMQILDESARYIPQIIPSGRQDLAKSVGAWEQFTEEGRNVGLGVTFLTQRSARMNKSVSELADAMISFRIVGPRSVEAVTDWLGAHVEKVRTNAIVEQLRKLPIGEALVVSPGWLGVERVVPVRLRDTFDSSATPKPGERRKEPGHAAKPDLEKYRVRMAATIERAKAEDPKELHRQIAALRRDLTLAQRTAQAPTTPTVERVEVKVPVLDPGLLHRLEEASDRQFQATAELREAGAESQRLYQEVRQTLDAARQIAQVRPAVPRPASLPRPTIPRPALARRVAPAGDERRLRKGAVRMLEAVARRYPARTTISQMAQLAKIAKTGGTFSTYMSDLRNGGHITERGEEIELTEAGWEAIGQAPGSLAPQTTDEVLSLYASVLRGGARRMLDVLMRFYPRALSRDDLGVESAIATSGGTFSTYLSDLRTAGLVEEDRAGLKASELLMNPSDA